ncbi:MAG: tetratricopeptide repeat protein [Bryobacteraceae bacterium]
MYKAALAFLAVGSVAGTVQAQNAPTASTQTASTKADRASAYYHYTLGHMYAELAGAYGNRNDYLNKAIDNYKQAIQADPATPMLTEELSELYIASGRLKEAENDAQAALGKNPNDVSAHRLLARVYTRQIGDSQQNRIDQQMLNKAIDEYKKIGELDPKDADSFVMLGRLEKVAQNSVEAENAYKKALDVDPANEDALMGLAMVYVDLGQNTQATDLLKKIADKNPSQESLRKLAGAYEQMHEYDLAAQTLSRAMALNPPDAADLRRAMAQDQVFAKKYTDALKTYQDLVQDDPKDAQSYLRMSQIYLELHDDANARAMSDKALAIDPDNIEIRYNQVGILEAEGKIPDAVQRLKDILDNTYRRNYNANERQLRVSLLEKLGNLYRATDQADLAVDAYRQIADLDPDLASKVSPEIVETYLQGKQYGKAEQEADSAVQKWPSDRATHIMHATVLAEMGKIDPAAAEIKKLLSGKSDRDTYVQLAQIYDKGRKFEDENKALNQAEKLSNTKEDKEDVWFRRGAMYERMKKLELSEAEFRKILQVDPDNAGTLNYLGFMLADRNIRLPEALDMIRKAVQSDPNNGAYLDSLGWVYYRMGRLPEAEENIRKALQFMPHDATVHDHMGDVLMRESKVRDAVAQWEASLKEWNTSSPTDVDQPEASKVKSKLDGAKIRLAKENAPAN